MKKKTDARREAILAAAQAAFEELGFEQATMSDICDRVGGSKATLYRYFDSKEALFLELMRRSAQEHGGKLVSLLEPEQRRLHDCLLPPDAAGPLAFLTVEEDVATVLKQFGTGMLRTFHTAQRLATWRMVISATAHDPQLGRLFYANGPAQGMKQAERYFEGVVRAGKLRQADPRVMCAHFRALCESEVAEPGLFWARSELTDEEIAAAVERAVDVFMRGYQ